MITTTGNDPSVKVLPSSYLTLGLLIAGGCFLASVGLLYLPVSTFTLIYASQLGFTAVFSFFLNSQKFTPFILNSAVLLTASSALLVFHSDAADSAAASKGKYAIGFVCTVGASAGAGLLLASTEFFFRKVLKVMTVEAVLELIIGQSFVASCVTVVGLFATGEWKGLSGEFEEFALGKVSLFCNVTSALGLPLTY
ncbi:hypothetical protein TIFTF001_002831 [Ficus carica]|uniref:Uncharacterized protein n=1 Tax=Ficus carica TaxID=3494 RepID=A0AA88CT15_FICCA|nr:hypothetical protein TIFTF001_002831 [Ficus carica]